MAGAMRTPKTTGMSGHAALSLEPFALFECPARRHRRHLASRRISRVARPTKIVFGLAFRRPPRRTGPFLPNYLA